MDELLGALHDSGAFDSTGRFTVARHAREKLRRFQLLEPQRCVLQFVAAAVAGNASKFEMRVVNDDLELMFDGFAPSGFELRGLFDYLFQGESAPAIHRELAIGVNTALQIANEVTIESWEGTQGYRIEYRTVGDELESPGLPLGHCPWARKSKGVRIRLRFKEASGLMDALAGKTPGRRHLEYIARHCSCAPIPLLGDGREVRHQLNFRPSLGLVRLNVPGLRMPQYQHDRTASLLERHARGPCAALLSLSPDKGRGVSWVHRGVTLRLDYKTFPVNVEGVIYCDHLPKNISSTDVVENEEFAATVQELQEAIREVVWEVVTADVQRLDVARIAPLVRSLVPTYPQERWAVLNAWILATSSGKGAAALASVEERLELARGVEDKFQADTIRRRVLEDVVGLLLRAWSCPRPDASHGPELPEPYLRLVPGLAAELREPLRCTPLAQVALLLVALERPEPVKKLLPFVGGCLVPALARWHDPESVAPLLEEGLQSDDPWERSACVYARALLRLARGKVDEAHVGFKHAEKAARSSAHSARALEGQYYTLPPRTKDLARLDLHRKLLGSRTSLAGDALVYYHLEERRLAWLAHDYGTWATHDLERFRAGWDPDFQFYLRDAETADSPRLQRYLREAETTLAPGDPWLLARLDLAARHLARLGDWPTLAAALFRHLVRQELLAGMVRSG